MWNECLSVFSPYSLENFKPHGVISPRQWWIWINNGSRDRSYDPIWRDHVHIHSNSLRLNYSFITKAIVCILLQQRFRIMLLTETSQTERGSKPSTYKMFLLSCQYGSVRNLKIYYFFMYLITFVYFCNVPKSRRW